MLKISANMNINTVRRKENVILKSYLQFAVDPRKNTAHSGVDTRLVYITTTRSPAGDPHQVPTTVCFTHQRSSTVTLNHTHEKLAKTVTCNFCA